MRPVALLLAFLLAPAATSQDKKPEAIDVTGHLEGTTTEVRPRVGGYISAVRVREGDAVKKGAVLAEIEPRVFQVEAERAKAIVTRAQAQAKVADARFDRVKVAVEKGIVPKEEVDQATAEREVARAELMAAKAELELAELRLSWTKITAPADGKLSRLNLAEGNIVRADTDILVNVVRTDPLFVVFDLDERTAVRLLRAAKDKKPAAAVGFATEDGFPHEAVVDEVAPVIDPQKATLRVRAKLPNPKGEFVPGQFARVRLNLPK
jgi:RND family efflux transporter MFP subunit